MTNERDPELQRKAEELAARDYDVVWSFDELSNGDNVFLVEHPELEGCMVQADTLEDALAELKVATVDFIYFMLEDGLEIPPPHVQEKNAGSLSTSAENIVILTSDSISNAPLPFEDALTKAIRPDFRKRSMEISGNLIRHG